MVVLLLPPRFVIFSFVGFHLSFPPRAGWSGVGQRGQTKILMSDGILGTADIAKKNVRAIHLSHYTTCVAIAGRDPQKLQRWMDETRPWLGVDVRACTYDELINDNNVDTVYIPLPTTTHKEWVIKTARAKKHILLEKPVAISATVLEEMLAICTDCGVRLMDGTMFMHERRYEALALLLSPSDVSIIGIYTNEYSSQSRV